MGCEGNVCQEAVVSHMVTGDFGGGSVENLNRARVGACKHVILGRVRKLSEHSR